MSGKAMLFVRWMVGLSSATTLACSTGDKREAIESIAAALTGPATVTLTAPNPLSVLGPVLESTGAVNIGANVNVLSGAVVAMGVGGVSTQPGALLNDVWSAGNVVLADRSNVQGTLFAATVTTGSGAVIHSRKASPNFSPPSTLTWTVSYPSGTARNVTVESGLAATLPPGLYDSLTVNSQARLNLSAGVYFLSALIVNSAASVSLDQTDGPVIIYVSGTLVLNGALVAKDGAPPDLLIGYLSPAPLSLNSPFTGAVVAPFAMLTLNGGSYTGFFQAQGLIVQANTQIRYQAPFAIAAGALAGAGSGTAGGTGTMGAPGGQSLQVCANLIVPPATLSGVQRDDAFQAALARYCTMPGFPQCTTTLVGRANADYTAAALRLAGQTFTPAQFLALSRDRTRKLRADEGNAARANALCAGPDSDGDWIVDSKDRCPGTPDLTATDDNGCSTALPPGPSAASVQRVLANWNMLVNPLCNGAPPPAQMAGAAIYQTAAPSNGTFIVSSRVTNQPAGCPVWYSFEIRELASTGLPIGAPMSVVFKDTEAVSPVAELAGEPAIPPVLVQFNARPTDSGTRGILGAIPLTPLGLSFRVQAVNGGGMRGSWSEWKTPSQTDCLALGIVCGHR